MHLTEEQINVLLDIANQNDGNCDRCHRVIRIYRYPVNAQMAVILRAMHRHIQKTGLNSVNFDELDIPYRLGTQRTKMRLHGLIKQQVKEDGGPEPNTWLITTKGGNFLRGEDVPTKVVVFDNQLLGHEGGATNIRRLLNDSAYQQEGISTDEAAVYSDIRTRRKHRSVKAMFKGGISFTNTEIIIGQDYTLEIEELTTGKQVQIVYPVTVTYPDIAEFQKNWKITEEIK